MSNSLKKRKRSEMLIEKREEEARSELAGGWVSFAECLSLSPTVRVINVRVMEYRSNGVLE